MGLDDLAIDLEAAVANSTPMGAELLGEVREQCHDPGWTCDKIQEGDTRLVIQVRQASGP